MEVGKCYIVTKKSDDGTFNVGDHISKLADGSITCREAAGWIDAEDAEDATKGMECALDMSWIDRRKQRLRAELAALESEPATGSVEGEGLRLFCGALAAEKEQILRDAISYALGTSEWRDQDLKAEAHRGQLVVGASGTETFVFDDVALVEFYPPEISQSGRAFRYRLLYNLPHVIREA